MSSEEFVLLENDHFRIEHAFYYRVAGFLFVLPKQPVHSLSEMSAPALELLGPTLSLASRAVEKLIRPINVYITKFGESDGSVHFHIFPRTIQLTDQYLSETDSSGSIDGPLFMSWANNRFIGNTEHGNIPDTIKALKEHFQIAP